MKNLPIYTVKERRPKNGENIFVFGNRNIMGFEYIEPSFKIIEYTWIILDEDGEDSGGQVVFNEGDDPDKLEEGLKFTMLMDGYDVSEDLCYSTIEDLEKLYE